MAEDQQGKHTEGSRYGPISVRTQASRTLPVQTQPPTQLMSHEMHRYTQLVHHESVERHVHGDTLVIDSDDDGGSGDTVVLTDNDGESHGDVDSVPNEKGLMNKPLENELNSLSHMHRDLPHSNATTEEGDDGKAGAGYIDTVNRSWPHIDAPPDNEGYNFKTFVRSSLPEVEGGTEIFTRQDTPQDALVVAMDGLKKFQSRRRSISSVRAASLRASGLRAASRSASLNSGGKDGIKFDFDYENAMDSTPGRLDCELKKPLQDLEAEQRGVEDTGITTAMEPCSLQSPPKVTALFDDAFTCMSTARSKSKSVSPSSEQGMNKHVGTNSKSKSGSYHPENMSAPLEPLSFDLKRLHSQASFVSSSHGSDAGPGADQEGRSGQPNSKKARKLVFGCRERSPSDSLGGVERITVFKASETDQSCALSKQRTGICAPARQGSVPSGVCVVYTNLSYLESQDPGEEAQMNALNLVDKLIWLDSSCMPDGTATSHVPQDGSMKCHAGIKGLQSLAQAAQMKAVHDKLDVFDWEDSQLDDEAFSPEKKLVPANISTRKRQWEAPKLTMFSKKQAISHQQKVQPVSHKYGPTSILGVGKTEVSNLEPLHDGGRQDTEMTPHTLLTTRLRSITKAESRLSSKGKQSPGLQRGLRKQDGMEKRTNEYGKDLDSGQQRAENDIRRKEQQAASESRRQAHRKKPTRGDIKLVQQKERFNKENKEGCIGTSEVEARPQFDFELADRTSKDDAAADIWIEAFSAAKNRTSMDHKIDLVKFKKPIALQEETGQDLKKSRSGEPSSATKDDKRLDISEQEVSTGKDRVGPGFKSNKDFKKYKTVSRATSAQHVSRRVNTHQSKEDPLEVHSLGKESISSDDNGRQKSKKYKVADACQLKGSSQREQKDLEKEWIGLKNDEARTELRPGQDTKEKETADSIIKKKRFSSHSGEAKPASNAQDKAVDNSMGERGHKTRSHSYDMMRKIRITQKTAAKSLGTSLVEKASQAVENPSRSPGNSRKSIAQQHSTGSMEGARAGVFTRSSRGRGAADATVRKFAKAREEGHAQGLARSKRRGEATDSKAPKSAIDRIDAVLQRGEQEINKVSHHVEELQKSQEAVVLGALRRTRSSTNKDVFRTYESVHPVEKAQAGGDFISEDQILSYQVMKSTTGTGKPLQRQNKKTKALLALEKLIFSSVADEGRRRRKRESGEICVLFSHSLTEEAIKHQKKIVAKLGGHIALCASECTHFISNGFVRSQNMLISMAAGKIVATTLWLECCGQAHYFVDEKNYILKDEKKEKEFGFSMITSLDAARRKPLFKDVKVIICSNTIPEPAALKAIVESAGGQIMDEWTCLSESVTEGDKPVIVIANEKSLETCSQLLVKGLNVYSEELVLQGVVTQSLDFSRNRLFEKVKQQRRSRRHEP